MTLKHETDRMGQPNRKTEPGHIAIAEARIAELGESIGADWFLIATAQRIAADWIRKGKSGEFAFERGRMFLRHKCLPSNVVPMRRKAGDPPTRVE